MRDGNTTLWHPPISSPQCSVISCCWFEISHGGTVYTTEIRKSYKSGLRLLFCWLPELKKWTGKTLMVQIKWKSCVCKHYIEWNTRREPSSIVWSVIWLGKAAAHSIDEWRESWQAFMVSRVPCSLMQRKYEPPVRPVLYLFPSRFHRLAVATSVPQKSMKLFWEALLAAGPPQSTVVCNFRFVSCMK